MNRENLARSAAFEAWRKSIRQGRIQILKKLVDQYGEENYEPELVLAMLRNNFDR